MFLSPTEIERLTGKKRHSAQIRWLRDHGYKFDVNGLGEPIVVSAVTVSDGAVFTIGDGRAA